MFGKVRWTYKQRSNCGYVLSADISERPELSRGQLAFSAPPFFKPRRLSGLAFAGPQIVLNGGALVVKATPLRGRLRAEP